MAVEYITRYRYDDVLSTLNIFNEEIGDKYPTDPLVSLLAPVLVKGEADLRASMAVHEQDTLTADSDAIDTEFNSKWTLFRDVAEPMAKAKELGGKWASAAEVTAVIDSHDRNLHKMSKDIQINRFTNVVTELRPEAEDSPLAKSGLLQLFKPLIPLNEKLQEIEKLRTSGDDVSKDLPAPYQVAKSLHSPITKLHEHMETLVEYGNDTYRETLNSINSRLEPITIRVKARKTKSENSSEQ